MTTTGHVARGRMASPALVGRDADLELLAETVAAPPAVVTVEGEAGIGKTRLVSELTERPELAGYRWLIGGCRRIREPFPLGPVIEAVRGLAEALSGLRLSPVTGALRPLLPELAPWLPLNPDPLEDRTAERHRVFRALAEVLDALGPVVLVLEDLHWADDQTNEFLAYLLADPPAHLSVVVTYRGEEVHACVRAVTAKLPAVVRRANVQLQPLDAEQTGTLVASILGTDVVSEQFAAHLCDRASGVPFAIEELLALLRARGALTRTSHRWARKDLDSLDVPSGIRDTVLERVSLLSDEARAVVMAAAVLQEPMPLSLLCTVTGIPKSRMLGWLEEAMASALLVAPGGAIAFRHVLAAQAVYDAIPELRRANLHDRVTTALQKQDPVPLGQLAYHLKRAGRVSAWAVAAERAADQATELGHDAEAVRLLEDVLRNATLDVERRGRLAVRLGRAAYEMFQSAPELIALLSDVLERDPPRAVRGELRFWLAKLVQIGFADPASWRRLLLAAVEDLDELPDLQAWAMSTLGIVTQDDVPLAEKRMWLDLVLEILPNVTDTDFQVFLLGKVAMSLGNAGDPAWRGLMSRMEERIGGLPRQPRHIEACQCVGMTAAYAGHHGIAQRLLAGALDGAIACENRPLELMSRAELALLDLFRGAWSDLDQRIEALLDELIPIPVVRGDIEFAAGCLALAQGDVQDARRFFEHVSQELEASGSADLLPHLEGCRIRLSLALGEIDEAVASAQRVETAAEFMGWALPARALPAMVQAFAAAGRGREARDLVDRASAKLADLDVPLGAAALRHARGFLAVATKAWPEAAEHLLAAARLYEPLECPYEAAQAREQAALAMFEAHDPRAEETLRAALATYQRLGASWDAGRATRLARAHGMRLPVPHRGGRKGYGDSLSPREVDVARLAAVGYTNKAIADELFLSESTVSKHLTRVMRKLRLHSRAAIASHLQDSGVTGVHASQ